MISLCCPVLSVRMQRGVGDIVPMVHSTWALARGPNKKKGGGEAGCCIGSCDLAGGAMQPISGSQPVG